MTTSTVAGARASASGDALGAADRGDAEDEQIRARRVAADDRHARLGDSLVEVEDVVEARVAARAERDDQAVGLRARRGEIAEVDGGGPKAEVAPRDPVEAEVDALDERVLRHDGAGDLRGVVLDPVHEAAALELGEQAELADVSEPRHRQRRERRGPRRSHG